MIIFLLLGIFSSTSRFNSVYFTSQNEWKVCNLLQFFSLKSFQISQSLHGSCLNNTSTPFAILKVRLPLLLTGDKSLNPGLFQNRQPNDNNEWDVSKIIWLQFIHINLNSSLPKNLVQPS